MILTFQFESSIREGSDDMLHLAELTGPHPVSWVDIETDDVLARLFYPCKSSGACVAKTPVLPNTWFYASGLAHFLRRSYLKYILAPTLAASYAPVAKDSPIDAGREYPILFFSHGMYHPTL